MKRRTAIAIKLFASLVFLSDRAKAIENYEPVLYTEKHSARTGHSTPRNSMRYGLRRGEGLRTKFSTAFENSLHHCWHLLHGWRRPIASVA